MPEVQTVRGPIDTAAMGRTLMHEHVFVLTPDVQQNYPDEWGDEDARVEDAVSKLQACAESGIRTIVDPTVIGLGRYIPRIQRVADRVPELNIVVATGCYIYENVPFFFHHRGPALGPDLPEPMVDLFVGDITNGIAGTGVRAAFLKCAIDEPGLTSGVERVMRAVAKAHHQTGVPITVHTHPASRSGLVVKRIMCDEEGVDPRRIVLGHSGDSTDADHLTELAQAGFVLGMDRFGLDVILPTQERADIVVEMCHRGFAEQLVLSHDAACYIDWIDPNALALLPAWNYLHLQRDVLPYLREHGVSDEQLEAMLVANPRRYFEA